MPPAGQRLTTFALTWATALATACSSNSQRSIAPAGAAAHDAKPTSAPVSDRTLSQLAAAERERPASRTDAAIPPGIEPSALAPRAADDPRAYSSLEAALTEFTAAPRTSAPASQPEATEAQRADALKAYAKGRNAALDARHLQAITEYQKALALDPDSPNVLREMARSYDAMGNPGRAMELLERLVQIDDSDADALLALGLAAASRRDFDAAIRHLGRLRELRAGMARDSAADIIADFTLATSLRERGYDRAMIEIAQGVVNIPPQVATGLQSGRVASVYRQRGDMWRGIGDAHARLGEFPAALDAWSASATLPSADVTALQPRIIYAHLRMGRVHAAQLALLHSLRAAAETGAFSERDVQLCAFIARHARPTDRLAGEVVALQQAHPGQSGLLRAAATLLPADQAIALLRQSIDQQPTDLQAVSQLLGWLQQEDPAAAAALTMSLALDHPQRSDDYADTFAAAAPGHGAAIEAVKAQPPSAARAAVLTRLLLRAGAHGEAWATCEAGLSSWPNDRALRLLRVQIAAAMREPAIVERAIHATSDVNDASGLIILSQARRSLGQTQAAIDLAQRAVESDPQSVQALIELSRAHNAHATLLNDSDQTTQSRAEVEAAVAAANHVIELAPASDDGYAMLALIYGPGGALADSGLLRETLLRLRQASPQSPLYNRLAAQESINQRRYAEAIERLINGYDANPADEAALALAVTAWDRSGQLDAAETWLRDKTAHKPGDASPREQLVRVLLRKEQAEKAIGELRQQVDADPNDWIARRMLENVYRLTGQNDSALELGEPRLLAQPEGIRREIDLANLYAAAELADKSLDRLERVTALAGDATMEDLANAMAVAGNLGSGGEAGRRERITLELARVTLERHADAPLQVYGSALRALARGGAVNEDFDALARTAVANARGANDTSFRGARLWQELAQALVQENMPGAAARVLRVRLEELPEFESPVHAALARVVLVLDAESAYQADDDRDTVLSTVRESVALVKDLDQRGLLQRLFDAPNALELAGALYETSVLYTLVGAQHGAEAVMREVIAADPDDPMTLNNLGYLLLERGDSDDEVVRMIERSHEQRPEEHNILDTIGWLRYKQGRFADTRDELGAVVRGAASFIQASIDSNSDPSAEVFDHLGDVKWRQGEREAALEAWRRVVTMLQDGAFRDRMIQSIAALQSRQWGIIVMDGSRLYDREYAPVLQRALEKIEAADNGQPPPIAPIWGD